MSNQRFITLAFVVAAIVAGVTVRAAAVEVIATVGWADPLVLHLLPVSILLALGVGILTFFVLLRNERAVSFTDEVVVELSKVFWPGREETVNSTTVVLITTFTLALSLALYDYVWAKITGVFLFSS